MCFRDAADRLDQLGQPYQAARARLCWAEIAFAGQTADGDRPWETADIVDAARGSMTTFDRLGARPLQDRTRRLLRALGERPAPRRAASGDLSDRELQVVRLVARGLSNAEIAEHLFISPRTVTTHLQHIYRRLGLSSRTALIRWVMDRGLDCREYVALSLANT